MARAEFIKSRFKLFNLLARPVNKRVELFIRYKNGDSWFPRLTPRKARELAAALTRAADQAEGEKS